MEINKALLVLAILAEGDSYGYAILQRVRAVSGGRMAWTDGMLYPVLHRLERLGHVAARWEVAESGRRRKYYRLTPAMFLMPVKRLGDLDALSREFAREHSERLWKRLVVPAESGKLRPRDWTEAGVAVCLAVAAVFIKIPALFVLPFLACHFARKRCLAGACRWLAGAFVAVWIVTNGPSSAPDGVTEAITALHLPLMLWLAVGSVIAFWLVVGIAITLWLAVGIAYAGGRWGRSGAAWTSSASRGSSSSTTC